MTETPGQRGRIPSVSPELLAKYLPDPSADGVACAVPWEAGAFRAQDALRELRLREERGGPVSLYFHLPFCESTCHFCACGVIDSVDQDVASGYVGYLERELATQRGALGRDEEVHQLYWGGGTPNFLPADAMSRLMDSVHRYFVLLPEGEYSIELDPRRVRPGDMEAMIRLGFNRVSLGVQDFDPQVQAVVNRVQSVDETRRALEDARDAGFRSVNFDLVYGMPSQSLRTMEMTLDRVLEMRPERIALRSYMHRPQEFPPQRNLPASGLPSALERGRALSYGADRLADSGYVYIGLGQFAVPEDDLSRAWTRDALHLGRLGYSTRPFGDLLSFGISAIAEVGSVDFQNTLSLKDYCASLDRGELPVFRGRRWAADDLVRRAAMQSLACRFRLDFAEFGDRLGVDAVAFFSSERARLREFERDGLVELSAEAIALTARGRLLAHAVCEIFSPARQRANSPARY